MTAYEANFSCIIIGMHNVWALSLAGVEVSLATQNELLDLVAYKLGEESVQESLTDEV